MLRVSVVVPAAMMAAFLALSGCNPSGAPPKVGTTNPIASAPVPSASVAPAASDPSAAEPGEEYPDPSKLLADDSDGDPDAASAHAAKPGKSGLQVTVHESGPALPWVVRIVNQGDAPAELVADTRLLWFEVKVPGQKATTTCKLPEQLGPTGSEARLRVTLAPGEGVQDLFDPRLYCFAGGDQKALVPGAEVTPHFGWPEAPPKKLWKGGKRVEEPTLQKPPFVAKGGPSAPEPTPAVDADSTASPEPSGTKTAAKRRVTKTAKKPAKSVATLQAEALAAVSDKELVGNRFALRSEYAAWSRRTNPIQAPDQAAPPAAIGMHLVQGSDARAEHNATVQLTLENQSPEATYVYFRREMVTFEVTGPRGVILCDAAPDDRAPVKQAFVKLASHGKRSYASRLAELCPRGTFGTPGLYLVYARFDATHSGENWGLHAFTGPVLSGAPAAIRIRVGEAPLLQKHMMPLPTNEGANGEPQSPTPGTLPGGPNPEGPPVPFPERPKTKGRSYLQLPAPVRRDGPPTAPEFTDAQVPPPGMAPQTVPTQSAQGPAMPPPQFMPTQPPGMAPPPMPMPPPSMAPPPPPSNGPGKS